jgi:acetylornithine deacetylase
VVAPVAATEQSASHHEVIPSRWHSGCLTFWTDAAILGAAGIPSVLYGPGGAGLHSTEEYVLIEDVCRCRDVLVELARAFV